MSRPYRIPLWKYAPVIRLLIPFTAGIFTEELFHCAPKTGAVFTGLLTCLFFLLNIFSIHLRYRLRHVQGSLILLILFFIGMLITALKDVRNTPGWYGHFYNDSCMLVAKISEPPVEKERSYKAEAVVLRIINGKQEMATSGKLLIYFSKKDSTSVPQYGDEIVIRGGLQPIRNSGNPGAFDYEKYMRFQGILYQVFLQKNNYAVLKNRQKNYLYSFIFNAREVVISALRQYIRGDKKVTGIAEALLIGYKEDLDKDVVQAYSNTGVVHIIAISGMHLGLIYAVLAWLFSKLPGFRKNKFSQALLIISCLWLFSLITGASASVLRSAVMFTCIVTGKHFFRQAVIYNSLAASAFILLVYDPYLLWDVGFQLSYTAVIGIVWLQKPIENLIYPKNNMFRKIWSMCAVTLAAQVLTLPVCIYYFHQVPMMFLITNLVCVPLSTVILFGEIFLLLISFIHPLAGIVGKCIYLLTAAMNFIVDACNNLAFSPADNIYATKFSTALLYCFVISFSMSLLKKKKPLFKAALGFAVLFITAWGYGVMKLQKQKKIIIYNVNRHSAVDFIEGDRFVFAGDEDFLEESSLQNFHLKPARILYHATNRSDSLPALSHRGFAWQFGNKSLLIIDTAVHFVKPATKPKIDILLIQKNAKCTITEMVNAVTPAVIIFDASNNLWKIEKWKKECEQLHLRFHIAGKDGAFVTDAD